MPSLAAATPISYTLSGTATFNSHYAVGTDIIAGTFTFDSSKATLDAVDITLTGPADPGAYDVPLTASQSSIFSFFTTENPSTGFLALFSFVNPLGDQMDPLSVVETLAKSTSVTGAATPSSVPEPPSLALLSSALGLFLLTYRLNRRGRRA